MNETLRLTLQTLSFFSKRIAKNLIYILSIKTAIGMGKFSNCFQCCSQAERVKSCPPLLCKTVVKEQYSDEVTTFNLHCYSI